MAYKKIKWQDHVVERPRTYTEAANPDGSKTLTPAPGEVLQQGTPQSATNFNNSEEALLHYSVAFDMLLTIMNAQAMEMQKMNEKLEALVSEPAADM